MSEPVIVDVDVAAPPERVWRALREPAELRRWHGWEHPTLDEEIAAIYLQPGAAEEAARTLDTGAGRFALAPRGAATAVRVTRPAPDGARGWDGIEDDVNEGWLSFVQQLRFYLERQPGRDRRTLVLDGPPPTLDGASWFRAERQHGIALDERTLAVVTPRRTIVSAWDLDEAAFARVRERLR